MIEKEKFQLLLAEVLGQSGAEGSSLKDFDGSFPPKTPSDFSGLERYGTLLARTYLQWINQRPQATWKWNYSLQKSSI